MATGFKGFLQGFASGGAEIVKEQDKRTDALQLFVAEQQFQQNLKEQWDTKQKQNTVDLQKSAVVGPQASTNASNTPTADAAPATGSGVTPVDPSTGTVAPSDPISVSPQAPATPATDAASYGAPAGPNANPTGVAASAPGLAMAKTQTAANAQGANAVPGEPNSLDDILAAKQGPSAPIPSAPASAAPALSTPTPAPAASVQPVTQEERAAALADLTLKHGKDITPSYEQLNALALQARQTKADTDVKNADTHTKAGDEHALALMKLNHGGVDENGNVSKADDQTLQLYGVPPAPSNAQQFGARGDTIKLKLQDNAVKASDAYHKIVADSNEFEKQLDAGAVTGGAANLAATLRQNVDSSYQIMKSINKDLTLESFKSGSGLRTQQEFKTIQDANASPAMKEDAARAILNKTKAFAQMASEEQDFLSNYAQAHNTIDGATVQYNKYLEANPIFDKSPGAAPFQLNANRPSYGEFFHPTGDAKTSPSTSDATAAPAVAKVDAGIAAAKHALTQGQKDAADKFGF